MLVYCQIWTPYHCKKTTTAGQANQVCVPRNAGACTCVIVLEWPCRNGAGQDKKYTICRLFFMPAMQAFAYVELWLVVTALDEQMTCVCVCKVFKKVIVPVLSFKWSQRQYWTSSEPGRWQAKRKPSAKQATPCHSRANAMFSLSLSLLVLVGSTVSLGWMVGWGGGDVFPMNK